MPPGLHRMKNKKPRPPTSGAAASNVRRVVRGRLERHRAAAGAGVHPVALDEHLLAAEGDVVDRAVGGGGGGAEGPRALVGVLGALLVVPGGQVRVRGGLLPLVGDDGRHAVPAAAAVGAGVLPLAGGRATGRAADERELDVLAADGGVGVPAAVLGAEARGLV